MIIDRSDLFNKKCKFVKQYRFASVLPAVTQKFVGYEKSREKLHRDNCFDSGVVHGGSLGGFFLTDEGIWSGT